MGSCWRGTTPDAGWDAPARAPGSSQGDRGIRAWRWLVFPIAYEDAKSLDGKLAIQLTWYGYSRSLFTPDHIEELLRKAGFGRVDHVGFRETRSGHAGIVELDNREAESLFVEAVK